MLLNPLIEIEKKRKNDRLQIKIFIPIVLGLLLMEQAKPKLQGQKM